MAKTIIIVILILVVIWAVFIRDNGSTINVTETPTPTSQTENSITDTEEKNSTRNDGTETTDIGAPRDTTDAGVLLNAQTKINEREGYAVDFHEYWAWRRYNNIDANIINVFSVDPESLEGRPYQNGKVYILTVLDPDKVDLGHMQGDPEIIEGNVYSYMFVYGWRDGEYTDIFNAMIDSFRFLE